MPQTIQVIDYRPHQRGALQGFVSVQTPSGFIFHGIAVFNQAGNRWCGLPNKPRLSQGKTMNAKGGGYIIDPVVEIPDRNRKTAFDRAVLAALDRYRDEVQS